MLHGAPNGKSERARKCARRENGSCDLAARAAILDNKIQFVHVDDMRG